MDVTETVARHHRCPKCNGTSIQRDLNPPIMDVILWRHLGFRAYTCRDCGYRFRDRPLSPDAPH